MSELEQLSQRTLGPLETRINQNSLKVAGDGWQAFKRIMSTITEPFFRMGMGNRYYNYGAYYIGMVLWFAAGLVSVNFASHASVAALLCQAPAFQFLAFIFQNKYFPLYVGLLMTALQWWVGRRNIGEAVRLQQLGIEQHSRSKGAAIWKNEVVVLCIMVFLMLLLNWPIAVLFAFGYHLNAKLKSAQAAAILDRYLDKLDEEIEKKYLKDAALGNCLPELTYLYHQIDTSYKPEVREKMAEALVEDLVAIVAEPPRKKGAAKPAETIIASGEPQPKNTPDNWQATRPPRQMVPDLGPIVHAGRTGAKAILRGLKRLLPILILGFFLAVLSWGGFALFKHLTHKAPIVADIPVPAQSTPTLPVAQTLPPAAPMPHQTPATTQPAGPVIEETKVLPPADSAATVQAQMSAIREYARIKILHEMQSFLDDQTALAESYKTKCESQIADNTNRIAQVSFLKRRALRNSNNELSVTLLKSENIHENILTLFRQELTTLVESPDSNPLKAKSNWDVAAANLKNNRNDIINKLNELDAKITEALK